MKRLSSIMCQLFRTLPLVFVLVLFPIAFSFADETVDQVIKESDSFLYWIVATVFGSLAGIAGWVLDIFIQEFIVNFGNLYLSSSIGFVIDDLWSTVRDIFNLTFIFGLVYIGFQIILGINDSQAKRTIGFLILAALLVNFSLFFTKFIVDFSNIAAVEIYDLFQTIEDDGAQVETSISKAFINQLEVSKILSISAGSTAEYLYIFCAFIIFLVLAYVFFAGAILIAIRFAALNLYMVFSPIMFIGWVFPNMARYSTQYMQKFLGQAFFAPAFLFMLYLSYRVVSTFNDTDIRNPSQITGMSETTVGDILNGSTAAYAPVFAFFILTTVFLVASMIVAKSMGAIGASTAISIGNNLQKGARNALWAGTGGAAAGGLGYLGYKNIDRMATSENRAARFVGRTATYFGARDAAEKKYKDSLPGKMAETRKKRTTEMATRSADASTKRDIKKFAENDYITSSGGTADLEKAVRGASTSQIIKILRGYSKESDQYKNIVRALTHEQRKKLLESKDDEFSPDERGNVASVAMNDLKTLVGDAAEGTAVSTEIAKLTPKQIDILGNKWIKTNKHLLTNSQIEKLASDSAVLGESEKSTFKKEWGESLEAEYSANPSTFDFKKYMDGRTAKDVAALPAKILTDIGAVPYLTDKVLREIAMTNMTTADRDHIDANVTHTPSSPGINYFSSTNNHYKNNW